jgi:hypothetical protein
MEVAMWKFGLLLAAPVLTACAVQPGTPALKAVHGEEALPPFAELNYAIDFGRACSPPDAEGRRYTSFVWLRANRPDGSHGPLRAADVFCDLSENELASAE